MTSRSLATATGGMVVLFMRWGTQRRAKAGVQKYPANTYTGLGAFIYSISIFKHLAQIYTLLQQLLSIWDYNFNTLGIKYVCVTFEFLYYKVQSWQNNRSINEQMNESIIKSKFAKCTMARKKI